LRGDLIRKLWNESFLSTEVIMEVENRKVTTISSPPLRSPLSVRRPETQKPCLEGDTVRKGLLFLQ
jgi:hypothetical protein